MPTLRDVSEEVFRHRQVHTCELGFIKLVTIVHLWYCFRVKLKLNIFQHMGYLLQGNYLVVHCVIYVFVGFYMLTLLEHSGTDYSVQLAWVRGAT